MKVKTINHVVPQSMAKEVDFMLKPNLKEGKALAAAIKYHKTVVGIVPKSYADWGFLGYAYFFQGDIARTKFCFKTSVDGEKNFFWYPYNLGILYLWEGQYDLALKSFTQALTCSFPQTIELMQEYKAYNLLAPVLLSKGYDFEGELVSAINNVRIMMAMCHYRLPIDHNDPRYFPRMF